MRLATQKIQFSGHLEKSMGKPLTSINLIAPAFKGLNTEDAALAQDPYFAEIADNAVIDRRGRLAARKGMEVITTTKTELGSESIRAIHEFRDSAGNEVTFSVGNNKILSGEVTLADETPGSYTISADNWKIVNFNDSAYFFQRGYQPLVYSDATGAVEPLSSIGGASGLTSAMYGNEVLAAYGRLWTADFSADKSTVYWSDLLQGHVWTGGTSGSIDLTNVWPTGYDEVVALAAHNNFLIIFGKNSILVYSGATSPASMTLSDTVPGVGCVDRDTVQSTGSDLIFLSHTGLASLGRTIQEKSMPINNLSSHVTKDLAGLIAGETAFFRSAYRPESQFYLLFFVGQQTVYCFDTRSKLEEGSYRVTRWPSYPYTCFHSSDRDNGRLLVGGAHGIGTYSGYNDNTDTYRFKYTSPELSFGDSAVLKMLKKIRPTIVGGSSQPVTLRWAYDFGSKSKSFAIVTTASAPSEYNTAEFNVGEFSFGNFVIRDSVNTNGSGSTLSISVEADIDGTELSIQEINVLALTGKIL